MIIQLTFLLFITSLTFDKGRYNYHSSLEAVMVFSIKQLPKNTSRYSFESIFELWSYFSSYLWKVFNISQWQTPCFRPRCIHHHRKGKTHQHLSIYAQRIHKKLSRIYVPMKINLNSYNSYHFFSGHGWQAFKSMIIILVKGSGMSVAVV